LYKKDTIDVTENRFVKFVLQSFSSFLQHHSTMPKRQY